jgi:hypothetical protein
VINVLRFIGAIGKDGNKTTKAETVFSYSDDEDFQKAFEQMVKDAYSELFALQKDAAWDLPISKLIGFFRTKDKRTELVGSRQAATFQFLAGFAGHGIVPEPTAPKPSNKAKPAKTKPTKAAVPEAHSGVDRRTREVGLTVRIEVNLPPSGDQETYDNIFRSIRENLLNAPKL